MISNNHKIIDELPKFICIGSQRAGTTWLHHCLSDHPQVYMPETKELHYFDKNYDKGLDNYLSNFKDKNSSHITWGEVTPDYYHRLYALKRIKQDIPNIKIIFIIRNPIDRAYSQYLLIDKQIQGSSSFYQTILSNEGMQHLSKQGEHLQNCLDLFGKENILAIFYDELLNSPISFIRKVYKFIGVNENHLPASLNNRINRVVFPKTQNILRNLKLGFFIDLIKKSPISEKIKQIAAPQKRKYLSNKERAELLSYFDEDIKLLERITQRDLSCWS